MAMEDLQVRLAAWQLRIQSGAHLVAGLVGDDKFLRRHWSLPGRKAAAEAIQVLHVRTYLSLYICTQDNTTCLLAVECILLDHWTYAGQ